MFDVFEQREKPVLLTCRNCMLEMRVSKEVLQKLKQKKGLGKNHGCPFCGGGAIFDVHDIQDDTYGEV